MVSVSSTLRHPRHIAVIMDGNGRWAETRHKPRLFGHHKGVEAVRQTVRLAKEFKIPYLTLFAFSTENWKRPQEERNHLFALMQHFGDSDLEVLKKHGVHIKVIGSREGLSKDILRLLEKAEQETQDNDSLHLAVAINYGSRDELARAARRLAEHVKRGDLNPEDIDECTLASCLDAPEWPDVDLVIRTGGEQRISNFLLWQSAYAEFVFLDIMWPDFNRASFQEALHQFSQRHRRFGHTHHDLITS